MDKSEGSLLCWAGPEAVCSRATGPQHRQCHKVPVRQTQPPKCLWGWQGEPGQDCSSSEQSWTWESWREPKASTAQTVPALGSPWCSIRFYRKESILSMLENPPLSALGAAAWLRDSGAQGAPAQGTLWDTGWEGRRSSPCAEQGQFL